MSFLSNVLKMMFPSFGASSSVSKLEVPSSNKVPSIELKKVEKYSLGYWKVSTKR